MSIFNNTTALQAAIEEARNLPDVGGGAEDKIIDRTISGEYRNDRVTSIGAYAFSDCAALTVADFPQATSIGTNAFGYCSALTEANIPQATSIGNYAFQRCLVLSVVNFPKVTSIGVSAFSYCDALTALILRNTETVCVLGSSNAFSGTPISSGTGYIYVPRALVNRYKAATNWSTYAAQFRALEDYTVDGTITGELDSSKI